MNNQPFETMEIQVVVFFYLDGRGDEILDTTYFNEDCSEDEIQVELESLYEEVRIVKIFK